MYNGLDFFSKVTEIYNMLEDDQSRRIFNKRLQYNLINSPENMREFISVSKLKDYENGKLKHYNRRLTSQELDIFNENSPIVLYGAADIGYRFCHRFELMGLSNIEKLFFCDKNYMANPTHCNIPIISPEQLFEHYSDVKIVITASLKTAPEIYDFLLSNGIKDENIFRVPKCIYSNVWYCDVEEMYFDPIVMFSDNEIFYDVGVYDAYTSLKFAENCKNKYDAIYLFEPDERFYNISQENIEKANLKNTKLFKVGLWDTKDTLKFSHIPGASYINEDGEISIQVNSLDNLVPDVPVTYIKMDIEGAEGKALIGAKKTIKKFSPKLAISIYHKPEDIIELPLLIKSINPNYKFYLRHYGLGKSETVLYAVI